MNNGLLNLQGSGTNIGIQAQRVHRGSCRSVLSGQHGACGQEKSLYSYHLSCHKPLQRGLVVDDQGRTP